MTPNKEDYLKCIYEIGTEEGKISNKEIANRMQVSPPAVTEMIKKLISEDLIIKDKVKGYLLTKTGKINVAELYRKHRLIEVFLVDHLQYTCDLIHQEAEILEHTVSDHFINALDRLLNYPPNLSTRWANPQVRSAHRGNLQPDFYTRPNSWRLCTSSSSGSN